MPQARWTLALIGPPRLLAEAAAGGGPALSRKDAALLALAACDSTQTAATIAALIWPDAEPRGALNNLRQRLFRLRKLTGARLLEAEAEAALTLATDLAPFEWPPEAALRADPGAWNADWLGGLAYDDLPALALRVAAQREAWQRHRREALARLAQAAEAEADLPRALQYAQATLRLEPLSEDAHREAMRLHYLRGDRVAALAGFEACRRMLAEEMGVAPGPQTLQLHATLLRAEAGPPPRRSHMPAALLRPPRLVGRSRELQSLQTGRASGRVLLMVGEAGIGKSRLLAECLAPWPGTLLVAARPTDAGMPLATLARLLRDLLARHPTAISAADRPELAHLLPELGPAAPGGGEGQRSMWLRALERSVAAAMSEGLDGFAIDDLHVADPVSARTLIELIDAPALTGLHWLFAQRPNVATAAGASQRQALQDGERTDTLLVGPLDETQLQEMVASLALSELDAAALAPALMRHTGGNPMFALETLRHVVAANANANAVIGAGTSTTAITTTMAGIPPGRLPSPLSISQLITRRLASLTPLALDLARVMAVADSAFCVALAEAVIGLPPLRLADAWRELEDAQVLRGERFAHDLVFEAARASIPAAIAARLHGCVAAFLVREGADAAHIAHHWERSGDLSRALAALMHAAEAAQAASQHDAELALLSRAQACAQALGDARAAFTAGCALARATRRSQGPEAALSFAQTLLAQAGDDARAQALALVVLAEIAMDRQAASDCLALALRAEPLARHSGDEATRCAAVCLAAQSLSATGRFQEARERLAGVTAWVDGPASIDQKLSHYGALGHALYAMGAADEAIEAFEVARGLARQHRHLADLHVLTSNLLTARLLRGEADEAMALAHQATSLSDTLGMARLPHAVDRLNLGLACLGAAHYAQAIAALEPCADDHDMPQALREHARTQLAMVWLHLGQDARALRLLDQRTDAATPPKRVVAARGLVRLEAARRRGQPDPGLAREALAAAREAGHAGLICMLRLRQPDHDGAASARANARAVLEEARRQPYRPTRIIAACALATALADDGETTEARQHAAEAAGLLEGCEFGMLYKPELMLCLHRVFVAAGDEAAAARMLASAWAWVQQRALPNVPGPFLSSFLDRQPVNLALRRQVAAAA